MEGLLGGRVWNLPARRIFLQQGRVIRCDKGKMDAVSVILVLVCAAMPKVAQLEEPEADPMDLDEKMENFIQSEEFLDVLAREVSRINFKMVVR